jgi:transcriptional regulator with XRE-family HTH domain
MEDIGRKLREARERLGLTLSEVERTTRIRVHYLEMLERGEIDSIPSVVQARGFLKNYADFLGLNTAAVLDDFAAVMHGDRKQSQTKPTPVPAPRPTAKRVRARLPSWLSADLFLAVLGGLGVVAVLIWGGGRLMASLRQDSDGGGESPPLPLATATFSSPAPTEPPLAATSDGVLVTSTPEPTATAPNIILGPANIIDLRIVGEMRAWARVIVDGEEEFSGRISPGDMLEFQGQQLIEVTTGNGAGLRVYFNGQDQGLLGSFAEVVIRLWTLEGAMTPTPTQQLEPPATSTPETTPTPTATETGGG